MTFEIRAVSFSFSGLMDGETHLMASGVEAGKTEELLQRRLSPDYDIPGDRFQMLLLIVKATRSKTVGQHKMFL